MIFGNLRRLQTSPHRLERPAALQPPLPSEWSVGKHRRNDRPIPQSASHHDIAIVDANTALVAVRRLPDSVAGFAELAAMLADAGDPLTGMFQFSCALDIRSTTAQRKLPIADLHGTRFYAFVWISVVATRFSGDL
jgi:hypothetical protein